MYIVQRRRKAAVDNIHGRKGKIMTDKQFGECLADMRSGDRQALHDIYTEYFKLIFSSALSVSGNVAAAEDITSEFFVRLWQKVSDGGNVGFDPLRGGHKRWLAVCAKNLAVNYIRKYDREELFFDSDGENSAAEKIPSAENTENDVVERAYVADALKKLSEKEREVIHLKYYCCYTLKDISQVLDIPLGTAAWRCRSAEQKLKKFITLAEGCVLN